MPVRRLSAWLAAGLLIAAGAVRLEAAGRRALLIGINDYTASRSGGRRRTLPAPGRDWPNLTGAVNDVHLFQETLPALYGFAPGDVVTITDQAATRDAILGAIEHQLVEPASPGDVLLFYYAGHGSQVRNSFSDEPDQLDESLVPADSRLGAPDIRDKELRALFNRILDRGAHLTVILDNCHSGSGARGLPTGAHPRGVQPDLRDVADRSPYGPRPENRGALVLSASEDADPAWETRGADGAFHGAFSWAWLRALRDSHPDEAAMTTFLRAEARMRAETPFQQPVIAGDSETRLRPFLSTRVDQRGGGALVAIARVRNDGTVALRGGWANGLSVGDELQILGDKRADAPHLTVIAVKGPSQSEARLRPPVPPSIRPGTLLTITGWAAPPGARLRVWMPRDTSSPAELTALAKTLAVTGRTANRRAWVTDPLDTTPAYVLRGNHGGWELLAGGRSEQLGSVAAAIRALGRIPVSQSLFVEIPAPSLLIDAIAIGTGTRHSEIEVAQRPEDADYILTGRFSGNRLSYCWLRPSVAKKDSHKSGLPLRSEWITIGPDDTLATSASRLRDAIVRLRAIHDWQLLETPPGSDFPYHLALRRLRDDELTRNSVVNGGEAYAVVLRAGTAMLGSRLSARYIYVFVVDSYGKSTLLFPTSGSVENRFPLSAPPPSEIALGPSSSFVVGVPYGVDTYYLLSTDEPLPDPWILEWDGIRARDVHAETPLSRLLAETASGTRAAKITMPSAWSIDRTIYESVAPAPRAFR